MKVIEGKIMAEYDRPSSSASVKLGTSSARVPLLSDVDADGTEKTSAATEADKEKGAFKSAEYKIAFSHFLVRSDQSAFK